MTTDYRQLVHTPAELGSKGRIEEIDDQIRQLVHTPAELAYEFVEFAEEMVSHSGVPFGVPAIDAKMIPMRPGNLTGIIALPGHGKTSIMAYMAREHAKRLVERGIKDEVVVYVTWEQSAEELEAFFATAHGVSATDVAWGREDIEKIKRIAVKRASIPIWVIGHGIGRSDKKAPRMTPAAVLGAIESMKEDFGVKPSLLLFDYIQLIPVQRYQDRVHAVTEVPFLVKELALRVGAPAVAGVQAKFDVATRNNKLPGQHDTQWASSIAQTADKLLSLWMPIKTELEGDIIEINDQSFTVTPNLLLIAMVKQRFDRGNHVWGMYLDPALLKLAELETRENGGREWPTDF